MRNQSGAVLAVSLVMLTAITFLAVMSAKRSGLQTRIVGNIQHKENVFHKALSEQEYWFNEFIDNQFLLSEALNNFTTSNNIRNYSPHPLTPIHTQSRFNLTSNLTHIPTAATGIALAEGQEVGKIQLYHFQLDANVGIQGRTMASNQRTGLNFPGLISDASSF